MVSNFPDINIYREKICVNTQQKGNFLLPVLIFYMYNIFRKTFFQFDRTTISLLTNKEDFIMAENLNILKTQEELLQFSRFNHDTAYKLGTFMVNYAQTHDITIAVSICMNNGCILFQHCPDGTNLLNQKWMERKFNTVKLMERSSLLSALTFEKDGDTLDTHALSLEDYALCGGGFPIRIKGNSTVIGAIISSNLYHIADHEFIINCLKEFLNCPEAPNYPYTLPE